MSMLFPTGSDGVEFSSFDFHVANTLMMWVKLRSDWNGSDGIVPFWDALGNQISTASTPPKISIGRGGVWANSTTSVVAGTWFHIAVRRVNATTWNVVLNGVNEATNAFDVSGDGASSYCVLAAVANAAGTTITQLRLWTTNLSDAEIAAEKASATLVKTASIYGCWPMATGTDFSDTSGNGRTLTKDGTPTTGSDDPTQGFAGPTLYGRLGAVPF
jgi:hypothetical protein